MGNRLLLADDSITIQKVVAIIFANEEFELTVVDNGDAALEKAREIRPDVMLVDALMPGKTGYEVCAEIRRDPQLSSIPILLLIGAFENPDEEEARSCGADASISKPFESQQLIDRVHEMLLLGKSRVANPRPISAAELWGDLASFDTMPAVAAAVAPVPAAPVSPPTRAQALPVVPPVTVAPFEENIFEASYDDDLWGAFEMDPVLETAVVAAVPVWAGMEPGLEAEESFGFEDGSEAIEEIGPAIDEELLTDDLPFGSLPNMERPQLQEYEPFSFVPETALELLEPDLEEPELFRPAAPVAAAIIEPSPISPVAADVSERNVQTGAPALSESDLVAALSKISREVIERIVWEVVPDLAEALIKEEIRKLKAGIRG